MNDPVFDQAKNALERLSADPAARELARDREVWRWSYETNLRAARSAFEARLKAAKSEELARWGARAFEAETLRAVFE